MKKLLIQQFLLTNNLNTLKQKHGIDVKIYEHKMSLNYNQINSINSDKLAQECRGLILAHSHKELNNDIIVGETEIIAFPFFRFFNFGQESAVKIDFNKSNDLKFFSKLDGTLIIFYYDQIINKWCSATRSVAEANLPIDGFKNLTFTTLFQKAIYETTGVLYNEWIEKTNLDKNLTYMFELTSPYNRIVVEYFDCKVHLLGVRNKITLLEDTIENHKYLNVPLCPTYKLSSFSEMMKLICSQNPLEHEGMVVCNSNFQRVKIKNPEYHAFNMIRDSISNSPRALIQIILNDKLDDLTPVLPKHLVELAYKYKNQLKNFIIDFEKNYIELNNSLNALGHMSDLVKRKQFFYLVKSNEKNWISANMDLYNKKAQTIFDFFKNQKTELGEYKISFLKELLKRIENY